MAGRAVLPARRSDVWGEARQVREELGGEKESWSVEGGQACKAGDHERLAVCHNRP